MGTAKKCYRCMTEATEHAKACPTCGAKLGVRLSSGMAKKPGHPLLVVCLAAAALAVGGKLALSHYNAPAAPAAQPQAAAGADDPRSAAIKKIKEKAADSLSTVGVVDIGNKEETLCLYVDQRFSGLSREQQSQLLSLVAGEWEAAIGKNSTAVKILEYGTEKPLADLTL